MPEPSRDETIEILAGTLPKFEHQTGKKMKYSPFIQKRIFAFIVDITSEFKRVYALGSRYPDVSLTLLKQAFSYTVYDGREFMDIFDIRKAIEDTKNIYPDVKKKELPRFDKEFEDIILEEKGEKPIEEWRKDEPGVNLDNLEQTDNTEVLVEEYDKLVEDKKKNQEVIGKTSFKKDRSAYNNKKDTQNLDDLLITGGIGLIEKDKSGVSIPINDYKVTKELVDDGLNDLLLNSSIGSILDSNDDTGEVLTYKRDGKVNDKLLNPNSQNIIIEDIPRKKKDIDLYKMEDLSDRIKKKAEVKAQVATPRKHDISQIDVSKYVNRLTDEERAKLKVKEEMKQEEQADDDDSGEGKKEQIEGPIKEETKETKTEKGDESMYGQNYGNGMDFYGGMGNGGFMPGGQDPYGYNNGMYPPPMNGPMQNDFQQNPMNQGFGGLQPPPPMGNEMQSQSPFGNQNASGFFPQEEPASGMTSSVDSNRETLFGVPMYDETKEEEMHTPNQNSFGVGYNQAPQADPFNRGGENFFGAPMYSEPPQNNFGQGSIAPSDNGDIFGSLLLPENNMRIKGGKIIDDFSGLKLPPESGKMIIGDVQQSSGFNGLQPPPQQPFNQMPNQGFGGYNDPSQSQFGMPNQGFGGYQDQSQFGMPQQSFGGYQDQSQFGMPNQGFGGYQDQSQFGMPQQSFGGYPNQGQFGMPQQPYGQQQYGPFNPYGPQQPRGPVFNELKVENNLLKKTPDDGGDYVNYSDLNKGKVDQNDMSKYVSQPKEEKPVPRVDLNLETGADEDEDDYLD